MSDPRPVILVTGASRGIGLAATQILLESFDANVVTISRTTTEELNNLSAKFEGRLLAIQGDVSKEETNSEAISKAIAAFSRLDGVILNAGTLDPLGQIGSSTLSVESWKSLFDVNFFSLLHTLHYALPHLRKVNGRVVMISSGAAVGGVAGWGAYSASKAAMNSLVRTLGNEEADVVTVALRPGVVDTAMQVAIRETGSEHMTVEDHAKFTGLHATASLVKPEDPAYVAASLSLTAPKELSGHFHSWDSEDLVEFRRAPGEA